MFSEHCFLFRFSSFRRALQPSPYRTHARAQNAYAGAFLDLGERHVLDLVVLSRSASGAHSIRLFANKWDSDALFLKAMGCVLSSFALHNTQ